jgi:hypothetical protein
LAKRHQRDEQRRENAGMSDIFTTLPALAGFF